MGVTLSDLELTNHPQTFFDSFNSFIMSDDTRVFNKLIARSILYDMVKDIPGDVVECGVFKGSGFYTFLKLKRIFNPNSSKKVLGFDYFDTEELLKSIKNDHDVDSMNTLFDGRNFKHENDFKGLLEDKLKNDGFNKSEFELIQGDVCETTRTFVKQNPGFKISLLYMDLDLETPTYETLVNLWNSLTVGGIVVFDEYGFHKWSESKGVDRFVTERGIDIKNLNFISPSAYIQKKHMCN